MSRLIIAITAVLASVTFAGDKPEGTQARLERYGKELAETWEKYSLEAQKNVRQTTIQDISQVFTREMPRLELPKDRKLVQIINDFIAALDRADDFFKVEKMKQERGSYVKSCTQVFKREYNAAVDFVNPDRTTQKCYDMLMENLELVRDKFSTEKDKDLRAEGFQGMNQLFNELNRNAKVPDGIDHADQLDKNVKEARRRFPMTTETMKAKNSQVFSMCEQAAKAVKQRAMQKQN